MARERCTCTARRWDHECTIHRRRKDWADAFDEDEEEPNEEPRANGNRSVSVTIDLSDPDSVRRGISLGLIDRGELDEFDAEAEDTDEEPEREPERAPKRRLSVGDRLMGDKNE